MDLFDLLQVEIYIEDIDLCGSGEGMHHDCTPSMSGTKEHMSHCVAEDARSIVVGHCAARVTSDLSDRGYTSGTNIQDGLISVSNGSNPLELFQVRGGTGLEPFQRA
jgi:hypothetical protein